jgi:hypothetical protein
VGGQRQAPADLPASKDTRCPMYRRLGWTGAENIALTGIPPQDRPARSESLYQLRYPGTTELFYNERTISRDYKDQLHARRLKAISDNYFKKQKIEKSRVFFRSYINTKLSGPTHNSDHGRHVGITDGRRFKIGTMFVPNFTEIPQLIQRLLNGSLVHLYTLPYVSHPRHLMPAR